VLEEKKYTKATWRIMEQLLEEDDIESALSGSLETVVETLNSEAGAIWLLDKKTNTLSPMFHMGPADISGISVENGLGVEGTVTKTGEPVIVTNMAADQRFDKTVFDDNGLAVNSMICVPLNDLHEVIGCVQVINKKDGSAYDEDELRLCRQMASLAAITIEEKGLTAEPEEPKEVLAVLENVIKEFPSGGGVSRVLKGINLEVYKNEFVVVLGESGCGKSTMINIIGGMDFLTDGKLTINGKDFSHPSEEDLTKYRRATVGFIFQAYNLMPNLTALENIKFIAELVDDPMDPMEALRKVGLGDKPNNYPGQLSGGQQQRVSIARAIVKKPSLILADEPTAALDYATSIEVLRVIQDIIKNNGTTVLMVTHNPEIAKMADRVVKVRSGRIASVKKNRHPLKAEELVW
jgi:ABC-type antimicrobial peptide transport system, ATPase component